MAKSTRRAGPPPREAPEAFDNLEVQLQRRAAAGERATPKDLQVVTNRLKRQREIVKVRLWDRVLAGLLLFAIEEFLSDLQQDPTDSQLFKAAGLSRFIEALIYSSALQSYPVRP
jgi:hypothetical protein